MFCKPNPDITDSVLNDELQDGDDESNEEYNYKHLVDMPPAKFHKNYCHKFISSISIHLSSIPIDEVFRNVWMNSVKIVVLPSVLKNRHIFLMKKSSRLTYGVHTVCSYMWIKIWCTRMNLIQKISVKIIKHNW
jgi:hypothetical protein